MAAKKEKPAGEPVDDLKPEDLGKEIENPAVPTTPEDVEALKAQLAQAMAERDKAVSEANALTASIRSLERDVVKTDNVARTSRDSMIRNWKYTPVDWSKPVYAVSFRVKDAHSQSTNPAEGEIEVNVVQNGHMRKVKVFAKNGITVTNDYGLANSLGNSGHGFAMWTVSADD